MDRRYFHRWSREGDLEHHARYWNRALWLRAQIFSQNQACLGFRVFPLVCINGEVTGKSWREARNQLHGDGWESKERFRKHRGRSLIA